MDIPQQTIYSWAKGRTQPTYLNLDKLCNVLECSVGDILEAEPVQNKLFSLGTNVFYLFGHLH